MPGAIPRRGGVQPMPGAAGACRSAAPLLGGCGERVHAHACARGVHVRWPAARLPGCERGRAINGTAFPAETDHAFWLDFARKTCRETDAGDIVLDYDPAIAQSIAAGGDADIDLWPLFAALQDIPTLVVRGAISDLLLESTVEEMQRRKPDLETVTVVETGHAPFLTEPAAWSAVRAFLA